MLNINDRIFFSSNAKASSQYDGVVFKTIKSLGLHPISYVGAKLEVRISSLGDEIINDLYLSKVVILLFGKGDEYFEPSDVFIIPDIDYVTKLGIKFLIYRTPEISTDELVELKLPAPFIEIENAEDLASNIKDQLSSLLA